jgi:hypothetical protein
MFAVRAPSGGNVASTTQHVGFARRRTTGLAHALAVALAVALGAVGCGGKKDSVSPTASTELTEAQIDADALALLPGASAIAVANVDARAFYKGELGAQLGRMTEKLVPIGQEANFVASRDLDRVLVASYALQGADVAAVLVGRFDRAKIAEVANTNAQTQGGGVLVASTYAGRTLYTVNNVGFCVLTPKTALAGTETGIRRALDRIRDGRATRDFPSWMVETIESEGAEMAAAVRMTGQDPAGLAVGSFRLPWLRGLETVRALGNFKDPGVNLAGRVTYAEPAQAQAGADGLRQIGNLAAVMSMTGVVPKIRTFEVNAAENDVTYKVAVDDKSLRAFLVTAEGWLTAGR